MISKRGKSWFQAKPADKSTTIRTVLFDDTLCLHKELIKCKEAQTRLALVNCGIKRARFSEDEHEIHIDCKTKIIKCSFECSDDTRGTTTNSILLNHLQTTKPFDNVTITVKVKRVSTPTEVQNKSGKLLTKQDILVVDKTANANLVLWGSNIGQLKEKQYYIISDATFKEYQAAKYISISSFTCIEPVPDIGEVISYSLIQL